MRAIGFRAEALAVYWAVVEGSREQPKLLEHGKISVSDAYESVADQLSLIRKRVIDTIERTSSTIGAVRFPEFNKFNKLTKTNQARLRVEGVVLESCASANVPLGVAGALNTIGKYIGADNVKDYLKSDELRGLKWPLKDAKSREAIMVAVAALED